MASEGHAVIVFHSVQSFLKLSTQESLQDPVYFVLLQRQKKTETEQWRKYSLLTARILSLALGSLMLGTLIYILVTYGSPFRRDAFTPWMSATLIDYFVIVIALSVWVAYKESSWLSAAFWIIPIILFGSTITSAYIALQLFSLSSQDPAYLVLFSSSSSNRQVFATIMLVLLLFKKKKNLPDILVLVKVVPYYKRFLLLVQVTEQSQDWLKGKLQKGGQTYIVELHEVIQEKVEVAFVGDKMTEAKLKWFRHVKRRSADALMRRCERLTIVCFRRGRDRQK
ncbi:hypothetical protein KY285_022624 [Solanum tuberosum]|nr:hypothetical protein KY284_022446 [Solanum tuberosum]KAH0695527.1 hypothetical protein KY285_022624 [Solanum tuberosum]